MTTWIIEYDDGNCNCGKIEVIGGISTLLDTLGNLLGCKLRWRAKRHAYI